MAEDGPYHVDASFHDEGHLLTVLVWLDGDVPCRVVIDTTADRTLIFRPVLAQADVRPFLISIDHAAAPQYRPEGVAVGQFWIRFPLLLGVDALPANLPDDPAIDGVLGMDWLTPHFERICLDFGIPALLLWPRSDDASDR
jgi:hypothetical protein